YISERAGCQETVPGSLLRSGLYPYPEVHLPTRDGRILRRMVRLPAPGRNFTSLPSEPTSRARRRKRRELHSGSEGPRLRIRRAGGRGAAPAARTASAAGSAAAGTTATAAGAAAARAALGAAVLSDRLHREAALERAGVLVLAAAAGGPARAALAIVGLVEG